MMEEKSEDFSNYPSLQDFKNLWEFKMACVKRDWDLAGGYPTYSLNICAPASSFWKEELTEITNNLTKGGKIKMSD